MSFQKHNASSVTIPDGMCFNDLQKLIKDSTLNFECRAVVGHVIKQSKTYIFTVQGIRDQLAMGERKWTTTRKKLEKSGILIQTCEEIPNKEKKPSKKKPLKEKSNTESHCYKWTLKFDMTVLLANQKKQQEAAPIIEPEKAIPVQKEKSELFKIAEENKLCFLDCKKFEKAGKGASSEQIKLLKEQLPDSLKTARNVVSVAISMAKKAAAGELTSGKLEQEKGESEEVLDLKKMAVHAGKTLILLSDEKQKWTVEPDGSVKQENLRCHPSVTGRLLKGLETKTIRVLSP